MKNYTKKSMIVSVLLLCTIFTPLYLNGLSRQELSQKRVEVQILQNKLQAVREQKKLLSFNKNQLESYIEKNKIELSNIISKLGHEKSKFSTLKSTLDDNMNQIVVVKNNLSNVKDNVEKVKSNISDVKSKIKSEKNKIATNRNELNNTFRYLQKNRGLVAVVKYLNTSHSLNGFVQQFNSIGKLSKFHHDVIVNAKNRELKLSKLNVKLNKLKQKLLSQAEQLVNTRNVISEKINLVNGKINLSKMEQNNLESLSISKNKETLANQQKLNLVKNKFNKIVTKEVQESQDVSNKNYSISVYAKALSDQEKAEIQKRIREQEAKRQREIEAQRIANQRKNEEVNSSVTQVSPAAPSISQPVAQKSTVEVATQPVTTDTYTAPAYSTSTSSNWIFPKTCHTLTEQYGEYHPELYGSYDGGYHHAVDYSCGFGTSIYAPIAGQISEINYSPGGFGTHIVFTTNYGGHSYKMIIGHFSSVNVYVGQSVTAGTILGLEGSTGNSTGSHTHFELWQDGYHVNPQNLWGY